MENDTTTYLPYGVSPRQIDALVAAYVDGWYADAFLWETGGKTWDAAGSVPRFTRSREIALRYIEEFGLAVIPYTPPSVARRWRERRLRSERCWLVLPGETLQMTTEEGRLAFPHDARLWRTLAEGVAVSVLLRYGFFLDAPFSVLPPFALRSGRAEMVSGDEAPNDDRGQEAIANGPPAGLIPYDPERSHG